MSQPRTLPPGFASMIGSFRLHLRGEASANTTRIYVDAAIKLAWWLIDHTTTADWSQVNKETMREYRAWLRENGRGCHCGKPASHPDHQCPTGQPLKPGYINNLWRAIQQFWRWYAEEEDVDNPMLGLKPPPAPPALVPVIDDAERERLLKPLERGKTFEQRRDYALLRVLSSSGIRLAECTGLELADVDLEKFELLVRGKGDKLRIVRIDNRTARAIDRYRRLRAKHAFAEHRKLWLAVNNRGPLTENGLRQIVERRAKELGIANLFPHRFRHDFVHRYLDNGGSEGDLMELMGWESPQMLRRYGRSARSARARRAYDRVNVMGDL